MPHPQPNTVDESPWVEPAVTKDNNRLQSRNREVNRTDEGRHKQENEAAERFADAIKESYQALATRSVSAQELNAKLTQEFFNGVITNLRTQAENNRALAERDL